MAAAGALAKAAACERPIELPTQVTRMFACASAPATDSPRLLPAVAAGAVAAAFGSAWPSETPTTAASARATAAVADDPEQLPLDEAMVPPPTASRRLMAHSPCSITPSMR